MAPGSEFMLFFIVFGLITALVIAVLYKLVTRDTIEYDLEFLWERQYEQKDLNLTDKTGKAE